MLRSARARSSGRPRVGMTTVTEGQRVEIVSWSSISRSTSRGGGYFRRCADVRHDGAAIDYHVVVNDVVGARGRVVSELHAADSVRAECLRLAEHERAF